MHSVHARHIDSNIPNSPALKLQCFQLRQKLHVLLPVDIREAHAYHSQRLFARMQHSPTHNTAFNQFTARMIAPCTQDGRCSAQERYSLYLVSLKLLEPRVIFQMPPTAAMGSPSISVLPIGNGPMKSYRGTNSEHTPAEKSSTFSRSIIAHLALA